MTYNFWQIGYGNMGKPIAESLRKESHHINLHIIDHNISYDVAKLKYNNINQLTELAKPDIILFALKPQNIKSALAEYQNFISCDTKIISIMAGVTIDYLQKFFPQNKIIRLMPNLGAKIQKSVNLAYSQKLDKTDQIFFTKLFNNFGITIWLAHERMLHAATAVAGSGPAYYYYILSIYSNYLIAA
ncbi:MAG: pyrroline-5-carboxylate reductase family protein, partial [Rickettsiales bacterium]